MVLNPRVVLTCPIVLQDFVGESSFDALNTAKWFQPHNDVKPLLTPSYVCITGSLLHSAVIAKFLKMNAAMQTTMAIARPVMHNTV